MLGSAESLSSLINLAQLDIILEAAPKFLEMTLHILDLENIPGDTIEEPEFAKRLECQPSNMKTKTTRDFHQMS